MLRSLRASFEGLPSVFWVLWVGTLINRLGLFVVVFLTLYLTSERGLSVEEATVAVSLLGLGSFTASMIGGILTDRIGRKPTFVISMVMTAILLLVMGSLQNTLLLMGTAYVMGLFMDLYRPAMSSLIADVVPEKDRVRAFSYLYWAINLGAAIAPIVAGYASIIGYPVLFVVDAITTLLFGLLVLWKVPETRPDSAVALSKQVNPLGQLRIALKDRKLVFLTLLSFGLGFMMFQTYAALPLDMTANGFTEADYGTAIAVNGALIVLISLPAAAWAHRQSRYHVLAFAAVLWGVGFGLYAPANTLLAYALATGVWTLGELLSAPVGNALISEIAPPESRGAYNGVAGMAWGLSSGIGPAVGGRIFANFGGTGVWLTCMVIGLLVAIGYWMMARRG